MDPKRIHGTGRPTGGFTLIELAITISLLGILGSILAVMLVTTIQLFIYLPQEVRTAAAAYDLIDMMIEGDFEGRSDGAVRNGMRYASAILDASADQFTYTMGYPSNTDKRNIRLRRNSSAKKIYRSFTPLGIDPAMPPSYNGSSSPLPGGTEAVLPINTGASLNVSGGDAVPNTIFKYYDTNGNELTPPFASYDNIRRVDIILTMRSGSGKAEIIFGVTSGVDLQEYK